VFAPFSPLCLLSIGNCYFIVVLCLWVCRECIGSIPHYLSIFGDLLVTSAAFVEMLRNSCCHFFLPFLVTFVARLLRPFDAAVYAWLQIVEHRDG
jgi:hypothetical protein